MPQTIKPATPDEMDIFLGEALAMTAEAVGAHTEEEVQALGYNSIAHYMACQMANSRRSEQETANMEATFRAIWQDRDRLQEQNRRLVEALREAEKNFRYAAWLERNKKYAADLTAHADKCESVLRELGGE